MTITGLINGTYLHLFILSFFFLVINEFSFNIRLFRSITMICLIVFRGKYHCYWEESDL